MRTHQATEVFTGIIKSFNNNSGAGGGYGFITRPGEPDMFVHISELRGASEGDRKLFAGDQVSFEIGRNRKQQPCAVNVRVQLRADDSQERPRRWHD